MEEYKQIIYRNYVKNHNSILYGNISIERIRDNFKLNDFYYKELLPKGIDSKILDIGCGDGNFVYYLLEKGYKNTIGIDLSIEQIEKGLEIGINNIEVADIYDYLLNVEEEYDCIIARDILEHFTKEELFKILSLIHKSLKSGGKLISQIPNAQGIYYTSIYYGDITHETVFTCQSLNQLFLNTGFSGSIIRPVNPYSKGLKGKVRSLLWIWKVFWTRFWKMVESGNKSGIFTSNIIAIATK